VGGDVCLSGWLVLMIVACLLELFELSASLLAFDFQKISLFKSFANRFFDL